MSDRGVFVRVASAVEIPEAELRGYELPDGRVAVGRVEQEVFAAWVADNQGVSPLLTSMAKVYAPRVAEWSPRPKFWETITKESTK